MKNISVIGAGYVGLVTAACLSDLGFDVTCMDIDKERIKNLKNCILPIYEPELEDMLKRNIYAERLKFTWDIKEAVEKSTAIFMAVGTPPRDDGSADLQYVKGAVRSIAKHINGYKVVVNKSTVPIGTARMIHSLIKAHLSRQGRDCEFDVVSNPEFLREGSAVRDFINPDRIVIGTESEKALKVMKDIYHVFSLIGVPFIITNYETAELIKYASNTFLATKISFINEMSLLCDKIGADVKQVAKAMGMDKRIGERFLNPGPGFGGSCFPKDVKALISFGEDAGVDLKIAKAALEANNRQKENTVKKIEGILGKLDGKCIGVLGISFKPETDDIRESPSIELVKGLLARNAFVKVYDPAAMENAKIYGLSGSNMNYCSSEYDCIRDTDAVVLMTEWDQFKHLDLERMKREMKQPYFFDFRNIYDPVYIKQLGFYYEGTGRR